MTYRELVEKIANLTEEQKNCDVTIYADEYDEYYSAKDFLITDETDVLDSNHPYITLA